MSYSKLFGFIFFFHFAKTSSCFFFFFNFRTVHGISEFRCIFFIIFSTLIKGETGFYSDDQILQVNWTLVLHLVNRFTGFALVLYSHFGKHFQMNVFRCSLKKITEGRIFENHVSVWLQYSKSIASQWDTRKECLILN